MSFKFNSQKVVTLIILLLISNSSIFSQKISVKIKELDKKEIYFEDQNGKKDTIFEYKKNTYLINKQILVGDNEISKVILRFPVQSIKEYYPEPKLKDYDMDNSCTKIEVYIYKDCDIKIDAQINFQDKYIDYQVTENGVEKYNESLQLFNKEFYKLEALQMVQTMKSLNLMNDKGMSLLNKEDVAMSREMDEFKSFNSEFAIIAGKMLKLVNDLYNNTHESYLPILLLNKYKNQFGNLDEIEQKLHNLPEFQQKSYFGVQLQKYLDGFKNNQKGESAAEFAATTFVGKEFKLSDLKGKFVIIDFWGTWCRPCVGGLPALSEFYEKHKDQLEIVGVASDKEDAWRNFLTKKTQYNWVQVLDLENKIMTDYGVTAFPTKFLINPEGKILLKEVGEGNDFLVNVEKYLKGESE